MGGGKAGLDDRKGGKAGHAKYVCPICKQQVPDLKTMEIHHSAKHDKVPFNPEAAINTHEIFGGTTQGVGVRGSVKQVHK